MKKLIFIPLFIVFILLFTLCGSCAYGDINSKVSEYEWSQGASVSYGKRPDMVRLGDSDYYLIVCEGENLVFTGRAMAHTIHIWNNNGSIQKTRIDSFQYDITGVYPSVVHVSGETYAVAYGQRLGSKVATLQVHENGDIIGINDTEVLPISGLYHDIVRVESKAAMFMVAYTQITTNDGFFDLLNISDAGVITPEFKSIKFDAADGQYPRLTYCTYPANHVLIAYTGTGSDGFMATYNMTTYALVDSWEFDTSQGVTPCNYFLSWSGTIGTYLVAYQDSSGDGQIASFEIDSTGNIGSGFISTLEYNDTDSMYNTIFYICPFNGDKTENWYGISFQGAGSDGFVCTLSISIGGDIQSVQSVFEYNTTQTSYLCPVIHVKNDFFLLTYEGTGDKGISCVLNISVYTSKWQNVNNSFNGQFRNTLFKLFDNSFNGQFRNTLFKLHDNSFNGQFHNTRFSLLDNSFNGSFIGPALWRLSDNDYNGSFISIPLWKLTDNGFNGSFRNISINITGGIIISNEFPLNNSVINYYFDNSTFYISFDINRTVVLWYNVSVFFDNVLVHASNHTLNASFLIDIYGNYSHELYYDTTYNWTVRANTSDGNITSAWFVFNTGTEVYGASLSFDNGQFVIFMILNLFGIIFSWGYWSKKRSGGFLMIFAGFLLIAFGILIGLGFIPFAGLLMVPFGIFIIVLGAKKAFYGPETEEAVPVIK